MSKPESARGQLTIDDLHTLEQTQPDDTAEKERARQKALEGGARYRQVSRDQPSSTPSIDQECVCGSHVSQQFVRVFGVDGTVHGCPECTDASAIYRGAATPGGDDAR